MAHRYFLSRIDGEKAYVTGDEAKHLCRVMRIKAGESLVLCDKSGFDYTALAQQISEDEICFDVISKQLNPAEPTKQLSVFMALPKSDKLEFITQKMCELGAAKLIPFVSEYCVAQKSKKEDSKKQRLQKISDEACKQCMRSVPMEVCETLTFKQVLVAFSEYDAVLFFYEKADYALANIDFSTLEKVAIIIGSEGGFSEKEALLLKENGAKTIGLGKRILRCETAAVTAASLTMFCLGQLE